MHLLMLWKFCVPKHGADTVAINSFIRSSCLPKPNKFSISSKTAKADYDLTCRIFKLIRSQQTVMLRQSFILSIKYLLLSILNEERERKKENNNCRSDSFFVDAVFKPKEIRYKKWNILFCFKQPFDVFTLPSTK